MSTSRPRGAITLLTAAMLAASGPVVAQTAPAGAVASAAVESVDPVLSGRAHGLRFLVYGPARLPLAGEEPNGRLYVSAHPRATLLGARWNDPSIILAVRAGVPQSELLEHHHRQLALQGFEREALEARGRGTSAVYLRGNDTLGLTVEDQGAGRYRVQYNLTQAPLTDAVLDDAPGATGDAREVLSTQASELDYLLVRFLPLDTLEPAAGPVRVSIPATARINRSEREGDGGLSLLLVSEAPIRTLFVYYRALLTAQGLRLASVDPDVSSDEPLSVGTDADANHVEATFARGADRIELLIDQEGGGRDGGGDQSRGDQFRVELSPWRDRAGRATDRPAGYDNRTEFDLAALPTDTIALRWVAPRNALGLRHERLGPTSHRYTFQSFTNVAEVAELYGDVLGAQGFERLEADIGRLGATLLFGRADELVRIRIARGTGQQYAVTLDFDGVGPR